MENLLSRRIYKTTYVYAVTVLVILAVGIGLSLHFNNGFPAAESSPRSDAAIGHIDYNHTAEFISDDFRGEKEEKILFIGDSYARDFINISRRFIDFSRVGKI